MKDITPLIVVITIFIILVAICYKAMGGHL